jgi:hypothetical protein
MEALARCLDRTVGLAPRTRFIVRGVLLTATTHATARGITKSRSTAIARQLSREMQRGVDSRLRGSENLMRGVAR